VLGHVAEMGHEDDVPLVQQVAEGLAQRCGIRAVGVEEVLRVGQHGEREALPGAAPGPVGGLSGR
jgi:hypothetical protein